MEARLATHLEQQGRIDEFTFCAACGQIVYLHDHETYRRHPAGVICTPCADAQQATDAAANDAEAMAFGDWQEHWQVVAGELVSR